MPTNTNAYNSRVTDEALEKRFRDTFRSQGGAELVDDLYAQGVIVPIVDFTAAATGQQLAQNLQTAWDFTTGSQKSEGASATLISNSGFWLIDATVALISSTGGTNRGARIDLSDGLATKTVYEIEMPVLTSQSIGVNQETFVVFLRAGDTLSQTASTGCIITTVYRQIATVNGDLVNPSGFTSS